ncbi:MAG: hypothetical protein F6K62_08630 [Sphaerospermopsis sp. SIO1G2]|nr:hypothetical protein [Sphaerospermopsis sp. SIO1G1]NET70996.1 hypothetical protein [Sphaerospermopsis sp. SIO1G2]
MTTEREYQEWRSKIRKVRKQKTISKPAHKPAKGYSTGLIIMIFLTLFSGLLALKIKTDSQKALPTNQQENLEYLNPTQT